ncbi:MAG: hypothetical protein CVU03_10825 [Bacteroidetes bacterium HGW-Bacteroidetes-2]|jgi:serine protease Do|nr:MAG: hypothetical protein CVU03_10825 [Bacteroidetes bacterium HGW-Bacteroidetes-2]
MKVLILLFFILHFPCANAQDVSVLFEYLDPSVVTIEVTEYKIQNQQLSTSEGLGSGVIISSDGLILTAAHVVASANEVMVKLQNKSTYKADVLSSSSAGDVALIKLRNPPSNLKIVKPGNSDTAKIGEQIIIIGAPLGLEHSLSVGHISRKMSKNLLTNGEMAGFIQTDASINHGNSGGPMFNLKGELIGIVSFILTKSGGFEGLGFAVDINTAKKTLFDVNTFWTGFDGIFLNEIFANVLNIPQQSGVLIQRITPNSFADEIGLKAGYLQAEIIGEKLWLGGDIILSIQGISCNEPHDLGTIKDQINNLAPGDTVIIEVLRKGEIVLLEANFTK